MNQMPQAEIHRTDETTWEAEFARGRLLVVSEAVRNALQALDAYEPNGAPSLGAWSENKFDRYLSMSKKVLEQSSLAANRPATGATPQTPAPAASAEPRLSELLSQANQQAKPAEEIQAMNYEEIHDAGLSA